MDFLIIAGDKLCRDTTSSLIEDTGHYAQPAANGEAGLALLKHGQFDAVLLDVSLALEEAMGTLVLIARRCPKLPIVALAEPGTVKAAVEAMRLGALDCLEKPLRRAPLDLVLSRLQQANRMSDCADALALEAKEQWNQRAEPFLDFTTPDMHAVTEVLRCAAKTPASILITGETGTGKSVLARTIHEQSHLAQKPFVTVSCPGLSKEMLESELFGHVKGSFTGAIKDHWGKVKAAEGGTLFFDEIADLPLDIQPKLLRILQDQEYERLGETTTHRAHLRIISATNRDLKKLMAKGAFREDLYFRLNVITVEMPPLRARHGDLPHLANHYFRHFSKQSDQRLPVLSNAVTNRLLAYSWPGNLRELRNCIERAVILRKREEVGAEDVLQDWENTHKTGDKEIQTGGMVSLEKLRDLHIRRISQRTANLEDAARILGVNASTLYRKRTRMRLVENANSIPAPPELLPGRKDKAPLSFIPASRNAGIPHRLSKDLRARL